MYSWDVYNNLAFTGSALDQAYLKVQQCTLVYTFCIINQVHLNGVLWDRFGGQECSLSRVICSAMIIFFPNINAINFQM